MAKHRIVTLAEETISWSSKSGISLSVIIRLSRAERDYFENGEWEEVGGSLGIGFTPVIDGNEAGIAGTIRSNNHPVIKHALGKIGIADENYERIMDAKARIESHPAWQAKVAARKAGVKLDAEYEAHVRRVENMMTCNGTSN